MFCKLHLCLSVNVHLRNDNYSVFFHTTPLFILSQTISYVTSDVNIGPCARKMVFGYIMSVEGEYIVKCVRARNVMCACIQRFIDQLGSSERSLAFTCR